MAETTIETENCHIYYDEINESVTIEWKGYSTSVQFRKMVDSVLKTLVKHKSSKVLADIKDMTIIGFKDQEWIVNNFLPRAFKGGMRQVAIIKPVSQLNQAAIVNILRKVDDKKFRMKIVTAAKKRSNGCILNSII